MFFFIINLQAIKLSEEPKRREWPFFNLMDVYFCDQVNDPSLRLFSSTKRFDTDTFDDKNFDEELQAVLAAANLNSSMSSVLQNLTIGWNNRKFAAKKAEIDTIDDKHEEDVEDTKSEASINLSSKLLSNSLTNNNSTNDKNNNKSHITSLNISANNSNGSHNKVNVDHGKNLSLHHHHQSLHHHAMAGLQLEKEVEPNNNTLNSNRNLMASTNNNFSTTSEGSINSSRNSAGSHANDVEDYDDNMAHMRAYERNLKNINQKFLHEMNEHHNIDQYLLSWRGFHGNMCKGFHNLQRDGQMVDVTIAAGGKIFKAHKLVKY